MAARKKPETRTIPCQYGCGRMAVGSLNVSFTSFSDEPSSYQRGFSVYVPACNECVKGAIKLTVKVPDAQS